MKNRLLFPAFLISMNLFSFDFSRQFAKRQGGRERGLKAAKRFRLKPALWRRRGMSGCLFLTRVSSRLYEPMPWGVYSVLRSESRL